MSCSGVYVFRVDSSGNPSELDYQDQDALDQLRAFDPEFGPFESDAFLEDACRLNHVALSFVFSATSAQDGWKACIPELQEPVSRLRNEIGPLYGINWRRESLRGWGLAEFHKILCERD